MEKEARFSSHFIHRREGTSYSRLPFIHAGPALEGGDINCSQIWVWGGKEPVPGRERTGILLHVWMACSRPSQMCPDIQEKLGKITQKETEIIFWMSYSPRDMWEHSNISYVLEGDSGSEEAWQRGHHQQRQLKWDKPEAMDRWILDTSRRHRSVSLWIRYTPSDDHKGQGQLCQPLALMSTRAYEPLQKHLDATLSWQRVKGRTWIDWVSI